SLLSEKGSRGAGSSRLRDKDRDSGQTDQRYLALCLTVAVRYGDSPTSGEKIESLRCFSSGGRHLQEGQVGCWDGARPVVRSEAALTDGMQSHSP
ncbi:hypothetical protein GOODEAATRI_031262, partial [Goodea atripinnis]